MKKIILLCLFVFSLQIDAQTNNIITKPLQLNSVATGSDSPLEEVLVIGSDKVVKKVLKSTIAIPTVITKGFNTKVVGNGKTDNPFIVDVDIPKPVETTYTVSTFANTDLYVNYMVKDSKGFIYVNGLNRVIRYAEDGTSSDFVLIPEGVRGVAISSDDYLYITTNNYKLYKISPSKVKVTLANVVNNLWDIRVDSESSVYLSGVSDNKVQRYNATNSNYNYVNTETRPQGMVIDKNDNLYVTTSTGAIIKYTKDNVRTVVGTISYPAYTKPIAIAIDNQDNLYITGSNNVLTKLTQAGVASTITTGLFNPLDIKIDDNNTIYLTSYDSNQLVIIKADGTKTTIPSGGVGPRVLLLDINNGVFYVSNNQSGTIEKVTITGVPKNLIIDETGKIQLSELITRADLNLKVDKVTGKSLISDTEITRLANVVNQDLTSYVLDDDVIHKTGSETKTGSLMIGKGTPTVGVLIDATSIEHKSYTGATSFKLANTGPGQGAFSLGTDTVKLEMRESGPRYIHVTDPIESPDGINSNHLVTKSQLDLKTDKTYTNTQIDTKVDKVEGKSLISNAEITRLASVTNQDISGKLDKNTAIVGATKTKITYDAKGLVTAGSDATTADIADSTNKRYVTDANLTKVNVIDQAVSTTEKASWNNKINATDKGIANGVATLDASGKLPMSQIPATLVGAVVFQGTYDAATASPSLPSPTGNKGSYWSVNVAGTQYGNVYGVKDWIISDGTKYDIVKNNNDVTSVSGKTGAIVLTTNDVTEGSNFYFTDARVTNNTSVAANTAKVGITTIQANAITANTAKVSNATHTGEVTGSTALTIKNNVVTNAKLATVATKTFKGRTTAGTGNVEDLTVAQVKSDLGIDNGSSLNNSISGNSSSATSWGGRTADFVTDFGNQPFNLYGLDNPSGIAKAFNGSQIKSWLGLGTNAYNSTAYLPLSGGILTGGVTNTSYLRANAFQFRYSDGNAYSGIRPSSNGLGIEYWSNNTSTLSESVHKFMVTGEDLGMELYNNKNLKVVGSVTATDFIGSSDIRYKENITSLIPIKINSKYHSYNFISDDTKQKRVGIIAQELEVNNPEFVRTDDKGMKSVSYQDLHSAEIAYLKAKVEELELLIKKLLK